MSINDTERARLLAHPGYQQLKSQRQRLAFSFAAICLILTGIFIVTAVSAPAVLTISLNASGTLTTGLVWVLALFLISWILTGIYIHTANTRFDAQRQRLLEELRT